MDRDHNDYWDEIDDFLEGKQATDKRTTFRKRILQEPKLAADVDLQLSLHNGIAYSGSKQSELKKRLQQIHQETQSSSAKMMSLQPQNRNWQRWLSVAAVLAIVTLGVVFWTQQSVSGNQDLFAANYTPYAIDLMQRGKELPDLLSQLDANYSSGDFQAAAPLLEQALANDPNNASLALAQAITNWENGQQLIAQQQLEALFTHPLLKDQAYWYAALFALQNEQTDQAKSYLSKINTDSGKLYQQAKKLSGQLK